MATAINHVSKTSRIKNMKCFIANQEPVSMAPLWISVCVVSMFKKREQSKGEEITSGN